jgi:Protein of unknown function (DUF5132)
VGFQRSAISHRVFAESRELMAKSQPQSTSIQVDCGINMSDRVGLGGGIMAALDNNGRWLLIGAVLGVGVATFGRELLGPLRDLARPAAKAALWSGMAAVERGRIAAARAVEQFEDLAAEIDEERRTAQGKRG